MGARITGMRGSTRRTMLWLAAVLTGALACGGARPGLPAGDDDGPASGTTAPSDSAPPHDLPRPPPSTDDTGTTAPEPPPLDLGADLPPPAPRPPTQRFVEVTAEAGLWLDHGSPMAPPFCLLPTVNDAPGQHSYCLPERFLGAAAVGDFDGDGWPDVFLSRLDGPARLMRNRGDGTFEDVAASTGLWHHEPVGAAAWLDVEGDGDLDLLLTSVGGLRHHLYVNDGAGGFFEDARERGLAVQTSSVHVGMGIGVGDYDLDGHVDVFVADWRNAIVLGPGEHHNRLLHNRGAAAPGHFEDVTAAMGIDLEAVTLAVLGTPGAYGFAPAFVDLDGDDWPELALVSDFGTSRLYANAGGSGFFDVTPFAAVGTETNGMGSTFGDLDGDGDLDWFVSSIWNPGTVDDGNRLYRNDGNLQFTDVTDAYGVREGGWGWDAVAFDVDLDGDLDLALAAGWPAMPFADDPVRLWVNPGPGVPGPWPEVARARGLDFTRGGRALVPFDYDRDGDLDVLVMANTEPPGLFRNDVDGGSWLEVVAVGAGANTQSLGARVRVQAEPGGAWQVRTIGVGGHLLGQAPAVAHFGLPQGDAPVHRVEVTWPASGRAESFVDVDRDQRLQAFE
jgi:hypothetical protein